MTQLAQDIISKFNVLPVGEQNEVAKILLRNNLDVDTPSLSDDELVQNAEDLFLELDGLEAENAKF